jgi:hypothetical protein
MDGFDFSELSDDQLIGFIRVLLRECVERGGAVQAAAQAAGLDEAEKAQVAREAAEREAAKMRAQERERVAREAVEAVRRQRETQERAAQATVAAAKRAEQEAGAERARREAVEAGRIAAQKMRLREEKEKDWLRRAAATLGLSPGAVYLLLVDTNYGRRVLINATDQDRYSRNHIVDWHVGSSKITTKQAHVGRKAALIAFCAEFAATFPADDVYLDARTYDFSMEVEPCQTS